LKLLIVILLCNLKRYDESRFKIIAYEKSRKPMLCIPDLTPTLLAATVAREVQMQEKSSVDVFERRENLLLNCILNQLSEIIFFIKGLGT